LTSIRIAHRFQGPSRTGQGGWSSARFEEAVGQPLTVSIRKGIPLETDLPVIEVEGGWEVRDGDDTILSAVPRTDPFVDTTPVSIEAAIAAKGRFPAAHEIVHPVPDCFSCGPIEASMGVHAGPLDDGTGRYAVDWTPPAWAENDGVVDPGVLWAALDCTTAWYICYSDGQRPAFTVAYGVEILAPIRFGETYAIVGWNGDYPAVWDGRKRGGASAAFDADGVCVARTRSFWVAAATDDPRITT